MKYNLAHLTQPENCLVWGPVQDDEALFLYSIVRSLKIKRVIEIGGGTYGYSGKNFSIAVGEDGVVYTVDVIDVPLYKKNQILVKKSASLVTPEDFGNEPVQLIFFDCHDYNSSMQCFKTLVDTGIINDNTLIALHDTSLLENEEPHQPVERKMVNDFVNLGYHTFHLKTILGLSICQKYKKFPEI